MTIILQLLHRCIEHFRLISDLSVLIDPDTLLVKGNHRNMMTNICTSRYTSGDRFIDLVDF